MVTLGSAKPPCTGSIPVLASKLTKEILARGIEKLLSCFMGDGAK